MPDVLLPFALDATGRMVSVHTVERGAACNCTCPQCGEPLVARKAEITWHFAHIGESNCVGAPETALHKLAKQIIHDAMAIQLPAVRIMAPPYKGAFTVAPERFFHATTADKEFTGFDGVIPDVLLSNDQERIAIEIRVAHRVEAEKIQKLRALGLDTVEIHLTGIARHTPDDEVVKQQVLHEAHRVWLFNTLGERRSLVLLRQYEAKEAARIAEEARLQAEQARMIAERKLKAEQAHRATVARQAEADRLREIQSRAAPAPPPDSHEFVEQSIPQAQMVAGLLRCADRTLWKTDPPYTGA